MEVASTLKRGTMNDWHLLLQMNSDDEIDWMWGDAGAMFYLMHRDDLQSARVGQMLAHRAVQLSFRTRHRTTRVSKWPPTH